MQKRSVSRFSPLDYILEIAAYSTNKKMLDIVDILEIIAQVRKKIELKRAEHPFTRISLSLAEKEDYWKQKYVKRRAKEVYGVLRKWKLLDENSGVTSKFKKIGEFYQDYLTTRKEDKLEISKILLLDSILTSKKEEPFFPSRFLLKIRDHSLSQLTVKCKIRNNEITEKIIDVNEEGIAYATKDFVEKVVNTNLVSFQVLRDWGKFFELTNWFQVRLKDPNVTSVISPKFGIYLTRQICTLYEIEQALTFFIRNKKSAFPHELMQYMSHMNKKDYSLYVIKSLLSGLEQLGLVKEDSGKYIFTGPCEITPRNVILLGLKKNCLIISDGMQKGVIFKLEENLMSEDLHKILFLFKPKIDLQNFYNGLKQVYSLLLTDRTQNFVYIPVLREETCKLLRITDNTFDYLLKECAHQYYNELEFVRAPQRFGLLKEAKFGRPIILNDNAYYLIRIIQYDWR